MRLMEIIKTLDIKELGLHEVTDDELKKLQHILLEMVLDIADICKENIIDWTCSGGSILGAVRHKGFIPWDDDIDIFMTRQNFERFCKVFPGKYADKYDLKLPGDKGNPVHYPRIYKKNTRLRSIQLAEENFGVVVDIFLLENTYDNKLLRWLHGVQCTVYLFIDSCVRMYACKASMLKYGGGSKELRKAVNLRLFFAEFFKFRSVEQWMAASDKCFAKVKSTSSEYVVCPSGALHYFGELFLREKMCTTIEVPFENGIVKIPKDYDYYLSMRYGKNYMTPPPKDKIERHIYVEFDLGDEG